MAIMTGMSLPHKQASRGSCDLTRTLRSCTQYTCTRIQKRVAAVRFTYSTSLHTILS